MDLNVAVLSVLWNCVVGLPVALGVSGTLGSVTEGIHGYTGTVSEAYCASNNSVRQNWQKPCLSYSSLKVTQTGTWSKDEIDNYFGGDVNHGDVCKWVVRWFTGPSRRHHSNSVGRVGAVSSGLGSSPVKLSKVILRTFWTGFDSPLLPFKGVSWFRQGVTSVTDDGTVQQMYNIVSFNRSPRGCWMVDQVR